MKKALNLLVVFSLILNISASCQKSSPIDPPNVTPLVQSLRVVSFTSNSAIIEGKVITDGTADISSRGVCWSTSENPTVKNNKTMDGVGLGNFSSTISGLIPGVKYYVRSYATNIIGTGYGDQLSFTTLAGFPLPILTTSPVSNITSKSVIIGGNISDDGGTPIIERGICLSKNQNPTISDSKTIVGSGKGSFSTSISGLSSAVTYYARAYATSATGTGYGNQISFTTKEEIVLTGSWKIDTLSTALGIVYNQIIAEEYPNALQYLKNNKEKIRRLLFDPQVITFGTNGDVYFSYVLKGQITGTYTQTDSFFIIKNVNFPDGINGASDNNYLELYYPKSFLINILYSILKETDPPKSTFVLLIDKFEAIAVYKKSISQ